MSKFQRTITKDDTNTLKNRLASMLPDKETKAKSNKIVRTMERRACFIINELAYR